MLRPSSTLRPSETLRTTNLIASLGEGGTLCRLALLRLRGSGKREYSISSVVRGLGAGAVLYEPQSAVHERDRKGRHR
jgi:hypothetical protein